MGLISRPNSDETTSSGIYHNYCNYSCYPEIVLLQYSIEFEFDPDKSARNAREQGLPFELAAELEWQRGAVFVDDRFMYGEERLIAFAPL